MIEYIPSPSQWVAKQVELYERSGGTKGTTLNGLPVVIVTNRGRKTGAIRKTPLMRVTDSTCYVLVASKGGAPKHPLWYSNIKAYPYVTIQDGAEVYGLKVQEVENSIQRQRLWNMAVEAYPAYQDYQEKTDRLIPILLSESMRIRGALI